MAEIQEKEKGGKKGQQKKMNIHIDFTPMVDMNMLLITFFMLCTSLSKPQTMEISMPSKDKTTEENQTVAKESLAVTIIMGKDDKVYYFMGKPNYQDYNSLIQTSYGADGLRKVLLQKNSVVVAKINELKKQKLEKKISEEEFKAKSDEIKKDKSMPVVMIKAADDSNYKNMIDVLDEMAICNISKYAIVDMTDGDYWLLKNLETGGELTKNIDEKKAGKK